jgi:hypothetical protein
MKQYKRHYGIAFIDFEGNWINLNEKQRFRKHEKALKAAKSASERSYNGIVGVFEEERHRTVKWTFYSFNDRSKPFGEVVNTVGH